MAIKKRKGCKVNGRLYSEGAEIFDNGKILDCVQGRWEPLVLVSGI
ncbi:MAG: hypothetical protein WAW37_16350 [Syntrophobacteraceae bacterium]